MSEGHYSACWFWEEVSKEADQDAVARALGHPEPSTIQDFSLETALPHSHGVADPTAPGSPSAPPNLDTNRNT